MAKNVDFKNDIITLTFTSIPMQESFSAEHGSELFGNALEQFLDGGRVTNEGGSHLQATGRNVTNGSLDIVRDPFHKVGAVLILDIQHLLVDLLHGHPASEHGSDCNKYNGEKIDTEVTEVRIMTVIMRYNDQSCHKEGGDCTYTLRECRVMESG